ALGGFAFGKDQRFARGFEPVAGLIDLASNSPSHDGLRSRYFLGLLVQTRVGQGRDLGRRAYAGLVVVPARRRRIGPPRRVLDPRALRLTLPMIFRTQIWATLGLALDRRGHLTLPALSRRTSATPLAGEWFRRRRAPPFSSANGLLCELHLAV